MLSSARAGQVADFLDMAMDIEPTKLRPMGYGKNYPVADNSTQEGREQNRRVDMTIVKDDGSVDQQLADLFDPAQFPKSGGGLDLMEPSTPPAPRSCPPKRRTSPPRSPPRRNPSPPRSPPRRNPSPLRSPPRRRTPPPQAPGRPHQKGHSNPLERSGMRVCRNSYRKAKSTRCSVK